MPTVGIVVLECVVLSFERRRRDPVVVTMDRGNTYKAIGVFEGRYLGPVNAETRKRTGLSG